MGITWHNSCYILISAGTSYQKILAMTTERVRHVLDGDERKRAKPET